MSIVCKLAGEDQAMCKRNNYCDPNKLCPKEAHYNKQLKFKEFQPIGTVNDIVINWLKSFKFDGLYNDDCGCTIDEFAPCGNSCLTCKPGVSRKAEAGSEFDFIIGPK